MQELVQLRRGRVRLGATPSLCTGLLPDVLRAFHDRYPGIRLLVEEGLNHLPVVPKTVQTPTVSTESARGPVRADG